MAVSNAVVTQAVQIERKIEFTTFGRKSGRSSRRILWICGDDERVFIRSGHGLGRDWTQNLLANGRGVLHVAGMDVPVGAVHLMDLSEARIASALGSAKYGTDYPATIDRQERYLGELSTFELFPDAAA